MILGLLLAFSFPVTLEARGITVGELVATIAKARNHPLLCAPDVAKRRVIAFVDKVSIEDFLARLADASGAEWVETPKGPRLEMPPKLRSEFKRRHLELQLEQTKAMFAQVKAPDPAPWSARQFREAFEKRISLKDQARSATAIWSDRDPLTPGARAAWRVLDALGPEALADIPWGENRVFSTRRRGRFLLPLPDYARQAVKAFNAEYAALQETLLIKPKFAEKIGVVAPSNSGQNLSDPLAAEASDITLDVQRAPYSTDLTVGIRLSSASGTVVNGAYLMLNSSRRRAPITGPVGALWKDVANIPVTPLENAEAWFRFRNVLAETPPSQAPVAFREPENYEPLSFLYADALQAVAKAKKLAVIAQVGDCDFADYGLPRNAAIVRALFGPKAENVKLEKDWLVIKAKDQEETDLANLDRKALGVYVRTILDQGYDSNQAYLPIARATGGLDRHPLHQLTSGSLRLDRLSGAGLASARFLTLLDRFPSTSKRLSVGDMTPPQRSELERFLLKTGMSSFQGRRPDGMPIFEQIDLLPNLAFPNGLTRDLLLDLEVANEDVAYLAPQGEHSNPFHTPCFPVTLALNLPPNESRNSQLFRLGRQTTYRLSLEAPGPMSMQTTMNIETTDLKKPPVPYSQLPEWFRQIVDSWKKGS